MQYTGFGTAGLKVSRIARLDPRLRSTSARIEWSISIGVRQGAPSWISRRRRARRNDHPIRSGHMAPEFGQSSDSCAAMDGYDRNESAACSWCS